MKRSILALMLLIPLSECYAGITNGVYEITFPISDMIFQQEITITNCWWTPNLSCMYYDVVITKKGSLKRFEGDNQTVRGILYEGYFKFIVPYANVVDVNAYVFKGKNEEVNGVFEGEGDVPYTGPNSGNNRYKFWMKTKDPEQSVPGYPPQGVGSPEP